MKRGRRGVEEEIRKLPLHRPGASYNEASSLSSSCNSILTVLQSRHEGSDSRLNGAAKVRCPSQSHTSIILPRVEIIQASVVQQEVAGPELAGEHALVPSFHQRAYPKRTKSKDRFITAQGGRFEQAQLHQHPTHFIGQSHVDYLRSESC